MVYFGADMLYFSADGWPRDRIALPPNRHLVWRSHIATTLKLHYGFTGKLRMMHAGSDIAIWCSHVLRSSSGTLRPSSSDFLVCNAAL